MGPTILLVEDERTIRELLSRFLERAHFKVLQAKDGLEGLAIARECLPDVIICDNLMPNMTGVEMFKALRESEVTRGIPILFTTGFAKACEELVKHDANARLFQKPFLLSDLVRTVRSFTGLNA